jgi:hypothetical protein
MLRLTNLFAGIAIVFAGIAIELAATTSPMTGYVESLLAVIASGVFSVAAILLHNGSHKP